MDIKELIKELKEFILTILLVMCAIIIIFFVGVRFNILEDILYSFSGFGICMICQKISKILLN